MLELMIADDNVRYAEHLNYVLTKEKNFKVINISNNGLEAIMYYNALKPDVLLLDLNMPGIDGIGVIDKLTDDKKNVIILSGSPEYRSQIKDAHKIVWIFDKTVSDETLVNAIKTIEKNLTFNELKPAIIDMLKKFQFDLLSKGTSYLIDAIFIAYNRPTNHLEIDNIMKKIAAQNNKSNYKNIQSTIDKCIKSTFNKQKNPQLFREIFPEFDCYRLSTKHFIENAIIYLENETYI